MAAAFSSFKVAENSGWRAGAVSRSSMTGIEKADEVWKPNGAKAPYTQPTAAATESGSARRAARGHP